MDKIQDQQNIMRERDRTDVVGKLLQYREQGYVFHGSNRENIDVLEPRKSSDISEEKYNTDMAVYASPDPCAASIKGIINSAIFINPNAHATCKIGKDNQDKKIFAEIPYSYKKDIEQSSGIVYVLPPYTFDLVSRDQWQTKSNEPVKPVDIVKTNLQNYLDLGGKIVWKE
jgi:hypothetical protein